MFIIREAICMFYCKPFNKSNVIRLSKIIDDLDDIEICYSEDSTEPILKCIKRIDSNPVKFKKYISKNEPDSIDNEEEEEEGLILSNRIQILQFLNLIYLPYNPENDHMYECRVVYITEMLETVQKYPEIFNSKNSNTFGKWCHLNNANYLLSKPKRKLNDHGKKCVMRSLYVLKKDYFDSIAQIVINQLFNYQTSIKNLKKDEYSTIEYVRKSHGSEDNDTRIRLLKMMCGNIKQRSLVDHIFVSTISKANEPLAERDTKNQEMLYKLGVLIK